MRTSQPVTYLFVDGGYLRRRYSEGVHPWFGNDGELDFTNLRAAFGGNKMFYYDCLDDIVREKETPDDFKLRVDSQEETFLSIQRLPVTHVTLGSLTGSAKRRRQKKVDILLALDMVKHAIRGNMNRAVLLAGDLDFEPVVKFLVDEGLYVEVVADKTSIASGLADAADYYRPLTFDSYYSLSAEQMRSQYPLPQRVSGVEEPPSHSTEVGRGWLAGDPCILLEVRTNFVLYVPSRALTVHFNDRDRLKLFCSLYYGELRDI